MTQTTSTEERLRHLFDLVAEKEPIAPTPIDSKRWREQTHRTSPRQGRRVLAGGLVAAVVLAGAIAVVVYGPRSSPEPPIGPLGSGPPIAGSYSMTYLASKWPPQGGRPGVPYRFFVRSVPVRLDMNANGSFLVLIGSGNSGTWRDSKGTLALKFSLPTGDGTLVQTIRRLGPNLGSKAKPGVLVSNGTQMEHWYAVRLHGRSGYEAAKAQWMGDDLFVGTGGQNALLQLAVIDLQKGEVSDTGDTSGYVAAIAAIKTFESMPITNVTPAISRQENDEIALINGFFGLPPSPWPGECESSGPGRQEAIAQWEAEPVQSLTGVAVAPLKKAVADLKHGLTTDTGDKSCYPAAIVDLQSLESATRAQMAKNVPWGYEIGYLNFFFHAPQDVLGGPYNAVVPK